MKTWSAELLEMMGNCTEVGIATERVDGSSRASLPIWVIRVGDELFVRSYRGTVGGWYRHIMPHPYARITAQGTDQRVHLIPADSSTRAAVDDAYRNKYGHSGPAAAMVGDTAAHTTMRITPA